MQRLEIGGWVLTDVEALQVVRCVVAGLQAQRENDTARDFASCVLARANGRTTTTDTAFRSQAPMSGHVVDEVSAAAEGWLTVAEAAQRVGLSVRQVRRLVGPLGGRRDLRSGSWRLPAGRVAIWAAERATR